MSEVEITSNTYRIGRLNAFAQFHIARRIAPLLQSLGTAVMDLPRGGAGDDDTMKSLGPIAEALAKMSDEDCNYVLHACLSVCQRKQQGGQWARVQAPNGAGLMFEDIGLAELMQIALATIQENLSNFFPAAPASVSNTGA